MSNALRPSEGDALDAWRALVLADREQVSRIREPEPPTDHYAETAARFRAGVRAVPELESLVALAHPDDVWLDIGAGGGRIAIPLANAVQRVIAVEPSPAMREQLSASARDARVENIEVRSTRWPDPSWDTPVSVALSAHSLYDIEDVGPFLDAMERHASRLCVVVLRPWARGAHLADLFEAVHGEPMCTLPALREFVSVLGARGRTYEVRMSPAASSPRAAATQDPFIEVRRLLWLASGSEKDERMQELVGAWWAREHGIHVPVPPAGIGIVSWQPPNAAS
ncbi:MAG: class I SAM-dependent methyltransferase [Dehalococcoidia bacterium]